MKPSDSMPPEPSFTPRNRLEELLVRSEAEPAVVNDVYDELFKTKLWLVITTATKLEYLTEQVELYGGARDISISFPIDADNNLLAFTSEERAQQDLDARPDDLKRGLLSTEAKELVSKIGDPTWQPKINGLLLNPYLPFCIVLPTESLLYAERIHAMGGSLQDLRQEFQPRISALTARHQPLANAIRNFCEQRPDVLAAYVGMVQMTPTKPAKPFVWYYTTVDRPLYQDSLEALSRRLYHVRDALFIRPATAASAAAFNSPANLAVYFSQFNIAPVFQRVH